MTFPLPVRIVDVALGTEHSLFLSDTGQVYAHGSNEFGQLGHTVELASASEPVTVDALTLPVRRVYAGHTHSMV